MIAISTHPSFRKSYQKRIFLNRKLDKKVEERIDLFRNNPENPILKDHLLKGSMNGDRAFSITGDIRIIYRYIGKQEVLFLDIGTHNQVYR